MAASGSSGSVAVPGGLQLRRSVTAKGERKAVYPFSDGANKQFLQLVLRDGSSLAIAYFQLAPRYDPSIGIILETPEGTATLSGRNLWPVYLAIVDVDAGVIIEQHEREVALGDEDTFVEKITWKAR